MLNVSFLATHGIIPVQICKINGDRRYISRDNIMKSAHESDPFKHSVVGLYIAVSVNYSIGCVNMRYNPTGTQRCGCWAVQRVEHRVLSSILH